MQKKLLDAKQKIKSVEAPLVEQCTTGNVKKVPIESDIDHLENLPMITPKMHITVLFVTTLLCCVGLMFWWVRNSRAAIRGNEVGTKPPKSKVKSLIGARCTLFSPAPLGSRPRDLSTFRTIMVLRQQTIL